MTAAAATAMVVHLLGVGADPDAVGGKAATIDRLVAAGAPVPPSAVLTVSAYRTFVGDPGVKAALSHLITSDVAETMDPQPVDEAFLSAPMPREVADAVSEAGDAVRGDGGAALLVVRSSATAEDLESASFAGQYRSVLGVESDNDLETAVRLVWASLWHPAPRFYRQLRGLDDDSVGMAVLIMRQVAATSSGVVFTVDPGGQPGCARIETVDGLADALVSGALTPSAFVVARGTPCPQLPCDARAALTESLHLVDALGTPLDVEWAHDGQQLWVVQARPITTTPDRPRFDDGFDTPIDASTTYTTAGIAEVLPGALPPLAWTTAGPLLEDSLHALLSAVGAHARRGQLVSRIRGRAALDFARLAGAVDTLPTNARDELEQQYFAVETQHGDSPRGSGRRRRYLGSRHDVRALLAQHRAAGQAEICVRAIDLALATPVALTQLPHDELTARRARALDLAHRTAAAQAIVAAAAVAAQARLQGLLAGWFPDTDAAELAQTLVADVVEAGSLNGVPVTGLTGDAVDRAAALAGSRAYVGGPTWAEDPDMVALAASTETSSHSTPITIDDVARQLAARPSWRTTRVLTGQVVDIRLSLLRRAVHDSRQSLARRERAKAAMLRLGGLIRRIDLELGRRLTDEGQLDRPTDVELLSAAELTGKSSMPTRLALVLRRRGLLGCEAAGSLPHVFTGHPHSTTQVSDHACTYSGWGGWPGGRRGHRPRRDQTQSGCADARRGAGRRQHRRLVDATVR